jgi:hypothetical protein
MNRTFALVSMLSAFVIACSQAVTRSDGGEAGLTDAPGQDTALACGPANPPFACQQESDNARCATWAQTRLPAGLNATAFAECDLHVGGGCLSANTSTFSCGNSGGFCAPGQVCASVAGAAPTCIASCDSPDQ